MWWQTTVVGLLAAATLSCASTTSPAGGVSIPSQSAPIDRLVAALGTVQGEFRDVGDLTYLFVSDSHVLDELAAYNEAAIPKLVDCLSRTHFVRATVDYAGRLRLGTLCFEVLVRTDYFEARSTFNLWPQWFVDSIALTFTAEPKDLRRAQRAWRAYLADNPLRP